MGNLTLKTAPASEPFTTAEAKTHLRVDIATDDTYIDTLVVSARARTEAYLRKALITQTWEYRLDWFPISDESELLVPMLPMVSVSTIKYIDSDGDEQTWSSAEYTVDIYNHVPRILPAFSFSWPTTRDQINAVTIEFVAGYGTASDVPQDIKHAMLLLIGEMYENREESVTGTIVSAMPTTAQSLLDIHQAKTLGF